MKCIILAAGYATRMYPLTENFPKPLLKVGNKTILDWLIDDIDESQMVEQYIVISNGKYYDSFIEWKKNKHNNIIVINDGTRTNEERLGAVKDIQLAIEKINLQDDFLVIAGDNVLDFSLKLFIDYCKQKKANCIMRYYESEKSKLSRSGVISIIDNDKVIKMEEKPSNPLSNWCCPPFYYYTSEAIPEIKNALVGGCPVDAPGSLVAWLCEKMDFYAMEMPGKRYDIGNIDNYNSIKDTYGGVE